MFKQLFFLMAALVLLVAPASAGVTYEISADGHMVEVFIDDMDVEEWIQSIAQGDRITACMNSTSGGGIDWDWTIDGVRNGDGFDIIGGFIAGTICDSPNWSVTGGRITGSSMRLTADYVGFESCAAQLGLDGSRIQPGPKVWDGLYGFPDPFFDHSTALVHMGPCN